jgi:hypothetical protein
MEQQETIPFHIRVIGKLFSILDTEGNEAVGEIQKFHFVPSQRNSTNVGKRVIGMREIDGRQLDAIWVHIGNDYFKNVGLWPITPKGL